MKAITNDSAFAVAGAGCTEYIMELFNVAWETRPNSNTSASDALLDSYIRMVLMEQAMLDKNEKEVARINAVPNLGLLEEQISPWHKQHVLLRAKECGVAAVAAVVATEVSPYNMKAYKMYECAELDVDGKKLFSVRIPHPWQLHFYNQPNTEAHEAKLNSFGAHSLMSNLEIVTLAKAHVLLQAATYNARASAVANDSKRVALFEATAASAGALRQNTPAMSVPQTLARADAGLLKKRKRAARKAEKKANSISGGGGAGTAVKTADGKKKINQVAKCGTRVAMKLGGVPGKCWEKHNNCVKGERCKASTK